MYQVSVFIFFEEPERVFRNDSVFYARVPVAGDRVYYQAKTIPIMPLVTRVMLHSNPQLGKHVASIHVSANIPLTPELSSELFSLDWVDHT